MKLLYYRIYYTIYRALIRLGQREETDMIRINVVFIQSLFTMFIALGILGFLISFSGKSIIVDSMLQSVLFLLSILAANVFMVFYKNKYVEIEKDLSLTWKKNKGKNALLTLTFIVCSITAFVLSMLYLKAHPLNHK